MNSAPTRPFGLLHHVCIVVRDLDRAQAYYESLGVGPWTDFPSLEAFRNELKVPDVEAFMTLRFRWCNLDNAQLQLCEPAPGASPQRLFLEERGEGVFHLGFTVNDLDAVEGDAAALGLTPWMRGRLPDRSGFTYFDTRAQGAGVTLEIRANRRV
jgi:methylmalonyl-CoA/ethylmalonyl-CoA epimerase